MTTDVAELFGRDPLKLEREDIDEIIAHCRKRRVGQAPVVAPTRRAKKNKAMENLDEFELDLS